MPRIITDFQRLDKTALPRPTLDALKEVVSDTYKELWRLIQEIGLANHLRKHRPFQRYVAWSLKAIGRKLMAIRRLSPYDHEANSLLRDLTEVVMDLFWLYSFYAQDPKDGEALADRFFKFGAKAFLEEARAAQKVLLDDTFLGDFFDPANFQREIEEAQRLVAGYAFADPNAAAQLRREQDKNWRALPELIGDVKDVKWHARCRRAETAVQDVANLKYAPYYKNLKLLSAYTHWDPLQASDPPEEQRLARFCRTLNIAIGFAHDTINLGYHLLNRPLPENVRALRQQFVWAST